MTPLPNLKLSLVITADQLLNYPRFPPESWANFSRKAYLEPIVVRDGFHDFVLVGRDVFSAVLDELTQAREALQMVRWEDGDFGSCFITQAEFDRRVREADR